MTPTYTTLVTDLARHLHNAGIGQFDPHGVYRKTTPPPIYIGIIPDEAGVAIGITEYGDDRWRDDTSPDKLVQIRVRGDRDPLTPMKIADQIFTLLHRQSSYRLDNATTVLSSYRHLRAPGDRDTNLRWHQADSYTFTLNP